MPGAARSHFDRAIGPAHAGPVDHLSVQYYLDRDSIALRLGHYQVPIRAVTHTVTALLGRLH